MDDHFFEQRLGEWKAAEEKARKTETAAFDAVLSMQSHSEIRRLRQEAQKMRHAADEMYLALSQSIERPCSGRG